MLQVSQGKMFTIYLKSYRIFQCLLVLMVFVSSELIVAGQSTKKCAEFGEYCLNHFDCCSNSCMSYMYRCTRGYGVYPYPFLGVSYKPIVTLDQLLEQNFGAISLQPQRQQQNSDIKGNGMTQSSSEANVVMQNTQETATNKNPEGFTEISLLFGNRLGEETNEIKATADTEAATDSKIVATTIGKPACAAIGTKCYTNDECCNKRCHGFLHQCVT